MTAYLGCFFSLKFPQSISLLRDLLIQAWMSRGTGRGGGGGFWVGSSSIGGRSHPRFIFLTGDLFELCLESQELLHCCINLVLVPVTFTLTTQTISGAKLQVTMPKLSATQQISIDCQAMTRQITQNRTGLMTMKISLLVRAVLMMKTSTYWTNDIHKHD